MSPLNCFDGKFPMLICFERNHFQDSTTARTVLATVLEIIKASGNDLNAAYPGPQLCPMLKCLHFSTTPMDQIHHIITCGEAPKGEIKCMTCRTCHDFKRWHAVCNTLKSPVELLRRLSNRKRGSNTSAGEPSTTKRGKTAGSGYYTGLSRQESHGVENVWREMEASSNVYPPGANTSSPAQLHADEHNSIHVPELGGSSTIRPLPTPPETRNHSWSEDSQNMVAYGDAKIANVPEQLPPYVVSPQTTFDDYEHHHNATDTLRLGIPPVQLIHESPFTQSPEGLEFSDAHHVPWAAHAVFREAEGSQDNSRLVPTALDATAQYNHPSEKSASIFSNSFPASRMPKGHRQKQNTWPMQTHYSNDIPRRSFDHHQPQIFDGVTGLAEQEAGAAATSRKYDTSTEPSIARHASFDAGAQDSITVSSTLENWVLQPTSGAPGDDHQQAPVKRSTARKQPTIAKKQYEECDRCGQQFGGEPKNRRQHLKRHVASTHGDVRFRCGHPGCGRSYNRVDNLHDHERKCHGFVMQQAGVAELAAGDVEVGHGAGQKYRAVFTAAAAVAEVEGSIPDSTGRQAPSAVDPHFDVFGYSISIDDGRGWRPAVDDDGVDQDPGARRFAGSFEEELDELMAGISGGQQEGEDMGVPDIGHGEADTPEEDVLSMGTGQAPRPLGIPCVSWR